MGENEPLNVVCQFIIIFDNDPGHHFEWTY